MRVLIDSSTLIALAKIGKLNILEIVFKEIFITTVIKDEILRFTWAHCCCCRS